MTWVKVARAADVKEGTACVVEAHGRRIALCNTGEGFSAAAGSGRRCLF